MSPLGHLSLGSWGMRLRVWEGTASVLEKSLHDPSLPSSLGWSPGRLCPQVFPGGTDMLAAQLSV